MNAFEADSERSRRELTLLPLLALLHLGLWWGLDSPRQRYEARLPNSECLRGEFMGCGMELLSIPFWLLAEARGKCAK
ncbi:hypothetical protein [Roseateles sp.]|uniref:hypothetical protein n=1 Tax=Roseateles sp. TaxID=1971397 RepID=UPI003BAA336B